MNQQLFKQLLPFSLLGILFVIALVTVFTLTDHYGLTIDDVTQDNYGQIALAWYTTFGRDASFLKLGGHQADHGAIFEVMIAVAQHLFGHQWQTRAVITGLAGVVGVLAIAICGFELGGW